MTHDETSTLALVLGMHRSGTSATASVLRELGFFLGGDDELLGPQADNERGFFERADVQVANDRLFADLRTSWLAPPQPDELLAASPDHLPRLAAIYDRMRRQAQGRPLALKDPRISVLWPVWEQVVKDEPTVVLCVRHPVEVALSLHQRDGLPLARSMALWEIYTVRSLQIAQGRRVVLAPYSQLVEDPTGMIASLAAFFGVPAPESTLVEPALRHHVHVPQQDLELTGRQRALWEWLSRIEPTGRLSVPDELLQIPNRTTELLGERRPPQLYEAVRSLPEHLRELEDERLLKSNLELLDERAELRTRLARATERMRESENEVGRRESDLTASQRQIARLDAQIARHVRQLKTGQLERARVERQRDEYRDRAQELEASCEAKDRELATAQEVLRVLDGVSADALALRVEVQRQQAEGDSLRGAIRDAEHRLQAAMSRLAEAEAEIKRLHSLAAADLDNQLRLDQALHVATWRLDHLTSEFGVVVEERDEWESLALAMRASKAWKIGRILTLKRR